MEIWITNGSGQIAGHPIRYSYKTTHSPKYCILRHTGTVLQREAKLPKTWQQHSRQGKLDLTEFQMLISSATMLYAKTLEVYITKGYYRCCLSERFKDEKLFRFRMERVWLHTIMYQEFGSCSYYYKYHHCKYITLSWQVQLQLQCP